jgi:hypothetical protein
MPDSLTGDENRKAVEILMTLPGANSPDDIKVDEKDKESLMQFFNCNEKMLTHRIFGWQRCSKNL